jgi:signal peptidase I
VYWLSADELGNYPGVIELPIVLGDEYLMLGDNSSMSKDSRFFGPVRADAITGVARWIYWPPTRMKEFE